MNYSITSKTYGVFNKITNVIKESMHVTFDEIDTFLHKVIYDDVDDDLVNLNINNKEKKLKIPQV